MQTPLTNTVGCDQLDSRIQKLIQAIELSYLHSAHEYTSISHELRPGKKYIKIVQQNLTKDFDTAEYKVAGRSVHAFVHKKLGALLKPATWSQPALGARYWLLNDDSFNLCLKEAEWSGSYLYIR